MLIQHIYIYINCLNFYRVEIIVKVIEIFVIVHKLQYQLHYLPLYSSGGSGFGNDFTAC